MNQDMQTAITEMINKINQGGDFLLAEAPTVLKQMVIYGRITNLMWIPILVTMLLVSAKLWRLAKICFKSDYVDSDATCTFTCIGAVICTVFSLFFLGIAVDGFIRAFFTPELYVFDKLADVIRTASPG